MPINITNRTFNSHMTDTSFLPKLMANIGDFVTEKIEFEYENTNVFTSDNTITLAPISIYTLDVDYNIYIKNKKFASNLKIGDELQLTVTGGGVPTTTFIIVEILENNTFKTNHDWSAYSNTILNDGQLISVLTYQKIVFNYNLVYSGTSYKSLTTNEVQELRCDRVDYSNTISAQDMYFVNKKGYQTGYATIIGKGYSNGKYKYEINHTFQITPLYLAGQIATEKPKGSLSLINKIAIGNDYESLRELQLPNITSNIGWYNENFNGGQPEYYISSLVYDNTINALDFNNLTTVNIVLKSNSGRFTNTQTKCKLNFQYLPNNSSEYQNNETLDYNYRFDSVLAVANNTDVVNTGVIKHLKSTFVNASTINIQAKLQLNTLDKQLIIGEKRYLLSLSTEDYNASVTGIYDRVNLLLDTRSFQEELANIDIIDFETYAIQHPYDSVAFAVDTTELTVMPVDDVVCNTKISIDFTGLENDGIKILNVKPEIVLKHASEADIILDSFNIATANYPTVSGIQNINFTQQRPFKIPNEIRKNIVLVRDFDNDSGNIKVWSLNFPFMLRWEYWKELLITQIPESLFDSDYQFNGINQNWYRLASQSGWSLNYRIHVEIERLGSTYQQEVDYQLPVANFLGNSDYQNCSIKSYDLSNNELINGSNVYIKGAENTKIVAKFEKLTDQIDIENVCIVMWLGIFEGNSISDLKRVTSIRDNDEQGFTVEKRVTVTKPNSSTYVGTCHIDSSKIPLGIKYTIYARIYDINVEEDVLRATNDDILRITMDNYYRSLN